MSKVINKNLVLHLLDKAAEELNNRRERQLLLKADGQPDYDYHNGKAEGFDEAVSLVRNLEELLK